LPLDKAIDSSLLSASPFLDVGTLFFGGGRNRARVPAMREAIPAIKKATV